LAGCQDKAGKLGLWFLIVAGLGEAMASIFDVTHDTGHGIAGLLGVGGFPVAALLLSVGLGHAEAWHGIKKTLLWIANLSWRSVVLLAATLGLMTIEVIEASGGHLASTRAEIIAARSTCIRRVGQPAHSSFILLVGIRCCVACHQATPQARVAWQNNKVPLENKRAFAR
jgi:hypothetical protein